MFSDKYKALSMGLLGILLIFSGSLFMIFWDSIFRMMLRKLMTLNPGEPITALWQAPPVTLDLDFYFFNWTNPEDFYRPEINPRFNEIGPYRFQERTEKSRLQWHAHNNSLSYKKKSVYHFDPEHSNGTLDDKLTIINSLTIGVIYKSRFWHPMKKSLLNLALSMYGNDYTMKSNIEKFTFKGVDDSRVNLVDSLPFTIPDLEIPFDKFGFAYTRNESDEYSGHFNIYTGADDIYKHGRLHTWNHDYISKHDPQCGNIEASPGEFQTPYLKENEDIEYFISDFCRKVKIEYSKKVEVDGITGLEYRGGLKAFDNGTYDDANSCYCQDHECLPVGVMNISACWFNFPLFVSYPHFYKADSSFRNDVDGMKPDQEKHELSMILEPTTGFLLGMKARLQLNLLVEPLQHSVVTRNTKRRMYPLVWVEYKMMLPKSELHYFHILNNVKIGGRLLGLVFILIGFLLIYCYPIKKQWRQHLMRHIEINSLTIGQQDGKISVKLQRERSPLISSLARSRQLLIRSLSGDSERDIDIKNRNQDCNS